MQRKRYSPIGHGALLSAVLLISVSLTPLSMFSQPPPGTTENPNGAVRLRTIWVKTGVGQDSTTIARGVGSAGDINLDGYSDFFVTRGLDWYLYLGGQVPADTAVWVWETDAFRLNSSPAPVIGDFLGTDEPLIGLRDDSCTPGNSVCYLQVRLFRRSIDSLLVPTDFVLDPVVQPSSTRVMAADLDSDGDDELIFVNREKRDAVVRIYEGGEDFSLEMPTKVIRWEDTSSFEGSRSYYSSIADFDGDSHLDLNIGRWYLAAGAYNVGFWWGGTDWKNWENLASRVVETPAGTVGPDAVYANFAEDLDGDGVPEIFGVDQHGSDAGTSVWYSRGQESARTREFSETTRDQFFEGTTRTRGFGYVADSLERYEMMALRGERDAYGFGGGLYGPNDTYDAHFGGGDGPAFGGVDAGDVNGDGWRDRLIASETYGGPGVGRAVIVAGGPYIPVDDPTVSVRSEPVAGEPYGLKLWPNPVTDLLSLAWRGDLSSMPHRMLIIDAIGRTIVDRGLPTWRGTTAESTSDYPAGSYRLTLFDVDGVIVGSTSFIVQR